MELFVIVLLAIVVTATIAFFAEAFRDGRVNRLHKGLDLADVQIRALMEQIARRNLDMKAFEVQAECFRCDPRLMAATVNGHNELRQVGVEYPLGRLLVRARYIYWQMKGDPKSRVGSKVRR